MPPPTKTFDPLIRKKRVLELIPLDESTLWAMIRRQEFPMPYVLNAGQVRELVAWRESQIEAWLASLPQRQAKPITEKAYAGRSRKAKIAKITRPG
jgi:predicted DNA-binding transcriptional regulator AlpA